MRDFLVPPAGFEPAIHGLKTRCPRPLDEGGAHMNCTKNRQERKLAQKKRPNLKSKQCHTFGKVLYLGSGAAMRLYLNHHHLSCLRRV